MLSVRTDDDVDLPWRAALELDTDARTVLRTHSTHGVTENHFGVVGDRAEQDAHQVVSHDLDLAVAARLVQRSQRNVVAAPAVGPHGRQRQDVGAGLTDRGGQPHAFGDVECGAADVDRMPPALSSGIRSTSTGWWPRRSSQYAKAGPAMPAPEIKTVSGVPPVKVSRFRRLLAATPGLPVPRRRAATAHM